MGYVVLWLENLAAVWLLTATVVACSSRWKWTLFRLGLPVLAVLLILAGYGGLTAIVVRLNLDHVGSQWLYPVAALTLCCAVGVCWILVAGLRRDADDPSSRRAAHWP